MDDPTSAQGLTSEQAAERLRRDGPNTLDPPQRRGLWILAGDVLREPMFLLVLGAGGIYLAMGDTREALVLLGFIVIIMAVTALQERRTDRALDQLRHLSSPRALVERDGQAVRIPGREVVVGDRMWLAEGDRIAADGVLLQAHDLSTDESLLTGESVAVDKAVDATERGRVFAGTLVVRGQGCVRVTATGAQTALGRIGRALQTLAIEPSPLREEVAQLTRRLVVLGLALCAGLAVLFGTVRGDWLQALLASISLAMSVLPQEFSVIMIVFFALGARRMAAHQVLTRRLNAIETLGQATVLCVDKTGTLTQNRMAVAELCTQGQRLDVRGLNLGGLPEAYHELLEFAVLASETDPHDPMERAFHSLAREHLHGTEHLHPQWSLAREYELSADLLAMTHLWRSEERTHDVVAAKGAPEAIADLCRLNDEQRRAVTAHAHAMAADGLRVLAVAKAVHPQAHAWPAGQRDFGFEWVGLVGLADPIRPQVPAAIAECQRAGIRVVMMTGDHPATARAIARQAGIDADTVLTGAEWAASAASGDASGRDSKQSLQSVQVFARVTPQQKLELVRALQACGEVVAMTGDGVNDAPALKAAHIGIAMGQRGTDVAREAASLVLLDDDFQSIVRAIRLGRRIYANLQQAMRYTLAVHLPIVVLSMLPVLWGMPLLLSPVLIAFLELVIDPSCSVVFEAQSDDDGAMRRPPRALKQALLSRQDLWTAGWQGLTVGLGILGLYAMALKQGWPVPSARTFAFVALVSANAALIALIRSDAEGWRRGWFHAPAVQIGVWGGTALVLAVVALWSPAATFFGLVPLSVDESLRALCAGVGTVALIQIGKTAVTSMRRTGRPDGSPGP